ALGQKQTSAHVRVMSALPPKADLKSEIKLQDSCGSSFRQSISTYLNRAQSDSVSARFRVYFSTVAKRGLLTCLMTTAPLVRISAADFCRVTRLLRVGAVAATSWARNSSMRCWPNGAAVASGL